MTRASSGHRSPTPEQQCPSGLSLGVASFPKPVSDPPAEAPKTCIIGVGFCLSPQESVWLFPGEWTKQLPFLTQFRDSRAEEDWKEFKWQAFTRSWPCNWHRPCGSLHLPFWQRDAMEMAMHHLCTSSVHILHFLHLLNFACEETAKINLIMGNLHFSLPFPFCCQAWKLSIHRIRGYSGPSISSGLMELHKHSTLKPVLCHFIFRRRQWF